MRTKLFTLSLLLMLLTTLAAPIPTRAGPGIAASPSLNLVGQIGGVTNAVVYSEGQLFTNIGPRIAGMAISDSDPEELALPPTLGGILPGVPEDLKLANGFLYVALGEAGVAVVDSATLNPVNIQPLPFSGFASAVAVGSQRLYVAVGTAGILAYDLGSDRKTLTQSQQWNFNPAQNISDVETQSVTVGGATTESLFASANNDPDPGGVYKFDITNSPALGGPVDQSANMGINAIDMNGSLVFAAGNTSFYALDIGALGTTSSVDMGSPVGQLCVGANPDLLYVTTPAGTEIFDFSKPATPNSLNATPIWPNEELYDMAFLDLAGTTYMYMAEGRAGLSVASASDSSPATVTDSSSHLQPQPGETHGVTEGSGQAFAFSNAADISALPSANPSVLNVVGSGIEPTEYFQGMTTYGPLLLISAGIDGLQRFEITPGGDPINQTGIEIDPNDAAYEAAVMYPNAVVADGFNGLMVVDLGNMGVKVRTGAPNTQSDFQMVDVAGNYAYILDAMDNGSGAPPLFRIYDLSVPEAPVQQGSGWSLAGLCGATGLALDLKAYDHFVYLACGDLGVQVVDVAVPTAPVLIGGAGYDSPGQAQGLSIHNGNMYVADGDSGVEWLTIEPSGALTLQASASVTGRAMQVAAAANGAVYVATGAAGLQVLQPLAVLQYQLFLPMVTH